MKKVILFGLILVLVSCSSQLYIPIEAAATTSLEDLKTGRELYVTKCSGCHQLHLPNQYNFNEWRANLNQMQTKAKINDPEEQLIYQYLINDPRK